jgi:hypothetical protein
MNEEFTAKLFFRKRIVKSSIYFEKQASKSDN